MASKTIASFLPRTLLVVVLLATGCNRCFYRQQADQDVACMVAQKSNDPRWAMLGFNINIDPRSRYFEPYSEECPPMPEDDPESHKFMHCVDGKKGWKYWHANGNRPELENPSWREQLAEYAPLNEAGEVILSLDSALQLAYIHSPDHQEQLETVYLSALDVTTERFRLDTQFFGGTGTAFTHTGPLSGFGQGSTLEQDTDFQLRRRFATAGELVVGIANSFVWQFAGPNTNSALSVLNISLIQPLLRGAGRDIALEQLTIVERALLANLRAYAQWRQGFYSEIAVGENSVSGPRRRGGFFGGTGLSGFTGQGAGGFGGVGSASGFGGGGLGGGGGAATGAGFAGGGAGNVGGFLGLLQSLQEIRNSRASLNLQLRTLGLLESSLDAGIIDLTQVDQFRQSIETEKATLLQAENALQNSLERYVTGTLGLPPDLPVTLDDALIAPFQLIESSTTALQDAIADEQVRLGDIVGAGQDLSPSIAGAAQLEQQFETVFQSVSANLGVMRQSEERRLRGMTPEEQSFYRRDMEMLLQTYQKLRDRYQELSQRRQAIEAALNGGRRDAENELVVWLRQLLNVAQELSLVQARAKVESLAVDTIEMNPDEAFAIAMGNRLDIMNNRASLVDAWRLIQFNADALQSQLDIEFNGSISTFGDNPVDFRGQTGTANASLRFDAPFTRLLERNNFRQQLIEYQRARRNLVQSFDSVFFQLRSRLRDLEQLRVNLEIQRRATIIAIRRVDLTRETLNEPQAPAEPGQPASQLGPTAATNLLAALSDLRATQNNFMSVYLNYYANRMLLAQNLGTMVLDGEGRWIDAPLSGVDESSNMLMGMESLEDPTPMLPPELPQAWLQILETVPSEGELPPEVTRYEVGRAP